MQFFVSGSPVGKARPRFSRKSGCVYTPHKTAVAESVVADEARRQIGTPCISGPVELVVQFTLPIPKSWPRHKQEAARKGLLMPITRPDYDNLAKLCSDALNGIAYEDDCQIVRAVIEKRYGDEPGSLVRFHSLDIFS